MRRVVVLCLLLATLGGCSSDIDYSRLSISDGTFIIARPGSRIVSERTRFGKDGSTVLCTEPSPDVAVALASSGNATISGGTTGASGSLGGGFTSKETVTALDGRTAGVVALRDGLYFACQAYANGVLGLNSYALILSEYSVLLRELVSGEGKPSDGKTPASAAASAAPATGVALTVVGGSMNMAGQPAKGADGAATAKMPALPPRNGSLDRAMLVSCIAENDPTRIHDEMKNRFLQTYCDEFMRQLVADGSTATAMSTPGSTPGSPTRVRRLRSVGRN